MEIEYYVKTIYGRDHKMIASHKQAQAVALISGCTTLTPNTEKGLAMLGLTFKEILPPKK